MTREVRVYNSSLLSRAVAERVASITEKAIATRGRFTICLSGGSTPRAAYELMTTPEYTNLIDWTRGYVFWGDERCVPPESPDSNLKMAREALLNFVPTPSDHIFRIRGELPPEEAAAQYEKSLHDFFRQRGSESLPRFDLVLLGMGADGHTASLFPGTDVLRERSKWVAAHYVQKLDAWRITLTAPVLNAAANVIFLVSGTDKAETLKRVLEGPEMPNELPSQLIKPTNGNLIWLLDEQAASKLESVKF